MFKTKAFATVTLVFAAVAVISTTMIARQAFAAGDDVFMDEGNGDFDTMPAPPAEAQAAPAAPVASKVDTLAPPPPAPAPSEAIPALTDDSAPVASPAPTSPSEDPAAPAAVEPKKNQKKKKEKKAAKTAAAEPAPASPVASAPTAPATSSAASASDESPAPVAPKGHFVSTKDACPMMRSPASTGEAMTTVKASRKIWVEDAGADWVKAWNKAGEPGYVSKDCVK